MKRPDWGNQVTGQPRCAIHGEDQKLILAEVPHVNAHFSGRRVPGSSERIVEGMQPGFVDREPAGRTELDPFVFVLPKRPNR